MSETCLASNEQTEELGSLDKLLDDIDEVESILLAHSASPSIADSKIYDESSYRLEDPFELLDGGLQVIKNEEKCAKNRKQKLKQDTEAESNPKKQKIEAPPEISDSTTSIRDDNKTCVSLIKESTFLRDFGWDLKDEKHRIDKILCSNFELFEIYQTLRIHASTIPFPPIFLTETADSCSADDRRRAILTLFSRRNGLKLSSETLHLGVGLLDKCLNKLVVLSDRLINLAAVAMVLASKVEEINYLSLQDVIVTKLVNEKSITMLNKLEQMILRTLEFNVTFPTPLTFANFLLIHLRALPAQINLAHYILELAVLEIATRRYSSDFIAHASVCLAFAISRNTSNSVKTLCETEEKLQKFSRIVAGKSRKIMKILIVEFKKAPDEIHEICFEYSKEGRDSVALLQIDASFEKFIENDGI